MSRHKILSQMLPSWWQEEECNELQTLGTTTQSQVSSVNADCITCHPLSHPHQIFSTKETRQLNRSYSMNIEAFTLNYEQLVNIFHEGKS